MNSRHFRRLRRATATLLGAASLVLTAGAGAAHAGDATGGVNAFVDRFSARIDPALAAPVEGDAFRALEAPGEGDRVTIDALVLTGCDAEQLCKVRVGVKQAGKGPRLLLVDAGAVLRGPGGADFVPVPNQRFIVDQSQMSLELEALPIWPKAPAPPQNTPLKAVGSNDPGLIAVLRSVQRIEAEDMGRLRRYVKESNGTLGVDTFIDNEDVRAARWMSWYKDAAGQVQGRYPRDAIRFALFAVSSGYTINDMADWFRSFKQLDMNPAIAAAGEMTRKVEMLLERGGLNYRVFSPNHADYHLNRGIKTFRTGDLEGAEKAFKVAIEKQGSLIAAHLALGITLYRAGKYADAEAALQIATGLPDAPPEVFYNRGATLFRLGDKLGAARMFRKVLELNPRDPDAGDWLAKADPENKTAPKAAPPAKAGKKKK